MTLRRRLTAVLSASALLAGVGTVAAPQSASADDATHLTIVGTSDVFDSGLMQYLLPKFQAATGISANYVSKGTGAAIDYAKAGTASALLVHAASLENQFVADGFSVEPYGRSVFWGDYILAGPANDPAGVASSPHDIVTAYEKIAAAGAQNKADFVSRGGTPGTTVQEHALWSLTGGAVTKCTVSAANGGGASPSKTGDANACTTANDLPAWYHATGLTQGPNVTAASTCTTQTFPSGACYVFTDRGTLQYLQSQGQAQNLKILVRNNDGNARGTQAALVNAFHAYAVNPAKVPAGSQVNPQAAVAFLNWLTSPTGQSAVGSYLNADVPFIPAAAPVVTVGAVPSQLVGSREVTYSGRIANAVPGYPSLGGVPVELKATPDAFPKGAAATVARATTDGNGNFSLRYTPSYGATYTIAVPQIQKVENGGLSPAFGDILVATNKSMGHLGVLGSFTSKAKKSGRYLKVHGYLKPKVFGKKGKILLYRAKPGHKLRYAAQARLKKGAKSYSAKFRFPRGKWKWQVVYVNDGRITRRYSPVHVVRIR